MNSEKNFRLFLNILTVLELFLMEKRKMNKIIIYYAHPLESYGSSQETSDIEFINKFLDLIIKDMNFDYGVEIINPGTKEIQKKFNDWKETEKTEEDHDMRFFKKIIEKCDGLVFRGR